MKSLTLGLALLGAPATATDLAITDVTVVDTRTGELAPHMTVVVHDNRIASVGTGPTPRGAAVLRGTGRFLIPGLWDFVTHLSWTRASALPVFVANGITAVRDQGGDLAETAVWAEGVRTGRLVGPTIFQVGPMLNGKSFNRYQFALGNPDQARGAVRLLKAEGVDGLEIERRVPRDVYAALMAEAKAATLPVGGKVPMELTPAEASDAGQATIDNLETIYDGKFAAANEEDLIGGIDRFLTPGGGGDALFATLARNRTAVTPSLYAVAYALKHNDPALPRDANYRYVARSQRVPIKPVSPAELALFQAMLPRLQATTLRLQKAGVTLLAGTDVAADRVPGFSLHEELDLLEAAGLTPLQVLQTATLNPAKAMGKEADYGTVEPGKVADLVLVGGDPTRGAAALQHIKAVVLHGRLLGRRNLDQQLRGAEAMAARD
ncbi:amidohydrolase family protein [Sphingomonas morindae]|uniref:Amidohydrolase family protein n=1 Tax=Sphingomonas morindae TaxID=1541170 RepID=A0ABY4X7I6_9SPHN|nr:amidohydrolase family protein [Sphingomonas morindae]USI72877.1 amidohydrolase family protein [Sphingomonas morindae]